MTTEPKNNETKDQTNEPSTFAPLGKYAVIGVVLVGVIVTTAVMLDKQLNKTETQIASIEDEISKLNEAKSTAAVDTSASQAEAKSQIAVSTTGKTNLDNAPATAVNKPQAVIVEETLATRTSETESNADTNSEQTSIISYKEKQRTRMTEMFYQINERENKQLEKFKAQQEEQVARLRKQVNVQQQQIDALIRRNENLFNLRSASLQRSQAQREQMLNRI